MGTGFEDYFDSSFGFSGESFSYTAAVNNTFAFPQAGLLHKSDGLTAVSAYRYHEEEMLIFTDGMRFVWRVGDALSLGPPPPPLLEGRAASDGTRTAADLAGQQACNGADAAQCVKCTTEVGGQIVGRPTPVLLETHVLVYTWDDHDE